MLDQGSSSSSIGKTFCEFFAGIGLVRAGLEPAGWRCVYANDNAPKKRRAYVAYFGPADHLHLGDVADTAEVVHRVPGRPFLATASFPCIDLSLAGHYRGLDGVHSSAFFGFADALDALGERKPAVVLVENVPGFLTSRNGADFAAAMARLADAGYWLDAIVLDACHFTPQSRPRVFVVGVLPELKPLDSPRPGWLWPPDDEASALRPSRVQQFRSRLQLATGWVTLPLPDPPRRRLQLADVIDTDDGQEWWAGADVRRHRAMMSEPHRRRVDAVVASGATWVGTAFRRTRQELVRAEVRFDGLAGCLRTPKGGSAKQIVVAVNDGELRMRWMTPREYARLQGAPDFPPVGTTIQQLWGFADAVCVPAVAWLDRHALTPLYDAAATGSGSATGPAHFLVTR